MVRVFAGWLQGHDARTEVPPPGLISGKLRRPRPYIYSDERDRDDRRTRREAAVSLWLTRVDLLDPVRADRRHRVAHQRGAELDDDDVDLDAGVITVRRGKNGKARFVPIAPCTVNRLRIYRAERMRLLGAQPGAVLPPRKAGAKRTAAPATTSHAVSQGIGLRESARLLQAWAWAAHP